MKTDIIWAKAEDNLPTPETEYVDIYGLTGVYMKLLTKRPEFGLKPRNLLLVSPQGLGKSLLAAHMGVRLGEYHGKAIPMLTFDGTAQTRDTHLRGALSREGVFTAGVLLNAINLANQEGACTVCIEEINAMPDTAQKQLNPLTDWRRRIYESKLGETFALKKDARVYIIATMNPSNYGGVNELNEDLRARFAPFPLGFPDEDQEKKILRTVCPFADHVIIDSAVKIALHSRQPKIERKLSTRDLVHFLGDVACLEDVESACVILANQFRGNDMRTMVDRIDGTFNLKLEKKMEAQLQASL